MTAVAGVNINNDRWRWFWGGSIFLLMPIFSVLSYSYALTISILGLMSLFLFSLQTKRLNINVGIDTSLFLLSFLWIVASSFWSRDVFNGLSYSGVVFVNTILLLLISGVSFEFISNNICRIINFLLIICTVLSFVLFIMYGTLRPADQLGHFLGAYGTRMAAYMATIMPFLVYSGRVRKNHAANILIVLCVLVGLLTESRSGLAMVSISYIISFVAVSGNYRDSFIKVIKIIPIVIILISLFLIFFSESNFLENLVGRILSTEISSYIAPQSTELGDRSSTDDWGRKVMYMTGWGLVSNPTVIGAGVGSLGYIIADSYNHFIMSHNFFITVIGELGLVGTVIYFFIGCRLIILFYRGYRLSGVGEVSVIKAAIVSIVVAFVIAQYRPMHDNPVLFFSLGVLIAANRGRSVQHL